MLRLRSSFGEIVIGTILIAIGTVWAVGAGGYGLLGEGGRLAPGTLPFACGVALAITGVFITAKTLFGARIDSDPDHELDESEAIATAESGAEQSAPDLGSGASDKTPVLTRLSTAARIRALPAAYPVGTVLLFLAVGLLLMPLLGFAISFALVIVAILRFVEKQALRTALLVGVVTSLFGFLLFEVLFNLPLPEPFFL
ncbi:hypothetical protein A20C1_08263 [marine actinobacterium PHSC20C1]|nr:hypothetical protein A20C1_08263 [marine actinobacterium PHSC20C1]